MKTFCIRILGVTLCILANLASFAQDSDYQTLFGQGNRPQISGFGAILNELSIPTSDKIGTFYSVGGEGAVLFNQRFYIGGYGLSSVAPFDIAKGDALSLDKELLFAQGGGTVGYNFWPNRAIHFSAGVRAGYGHLQQVDRSLDIEIEENRLKYPYISMVVVAPHVDVEANFFPWMKVKGGIGYRQAFGKENFGVDPAKDLSQTTINLGVVFGWFKTPNK